MLDTLETTVKSDDLDGLSGPNAGADPGCAKEGGQWRARGARAENGGLGAPSPARSRAEPLMGVRGLRPLKLRSFGVFHIQTSD
jgi:hypothetical protein